MLAAIPFVLLSVGLGSASLGSNAGSAPARPCWSGPWRSHRTRRHAFQTPGHCRLRGGPWVSELVVEDQCGA